MARAARRAVAVVGTAAMLLAVAACDVSVDQGGHVSLDGVGGRAEDQWTRRYELSAGGRFVLTNINGRVTAEAGSGEAVEVTGRRVARAISDDAAARYLEALTIDETMSADGVQLTVKAPQDGRGNHEIEWTVRVPKGIAVDLRTVNGGVRVNGVEGAVRAESTNGGVTGRDLRPSTLTAAVKNGSVDMALDALAGDGPIDLESVNGRVTLALPDDARGDVTAETTHGAVSVQGFDLQAADGQSRRRVQGRLNGGGPRISLHTTNGSVRILRADAR